MAIKTGTSLWLAALLGTSLLSATPAWAQLGQLTQSDADLDLAADSPFRDPDIIYLEADTLDNDEASGVLTASGEVEGRYQDRTLRADRVVYNLSTGEVIASGNVILIQADGSSQYADKLELSNELETGTATDFVARLPDGGVTAARFVARGSDGEVELYNAYYTACEVCEEKEKPSWRIKARQVTQDKASRTVQYRDATIEMFGIPVFYTPYLAHPDPSAERASGILTPFAGYSQSRGLNVKVPYYWAIDDYTEATFTPRIYTKVNPLLEYQVARQFHTGRIEVDGSFTYGSIFDRNGNPFEDPNLFANPDRAPVGKRLRSHIFAKGLFAPTDFWTYGFGVQLTTDDNYLRRYGLSAQTKTQGLYSGESQRNTTQGFLIGQNDSTRLTVSTVGFQSLFDRIRDDGDGTFTVSRVNDNTLPILAPRIELEHYMTDPVLGGRLKADGNLTVLTRNQGSNYTRGTFELDYLKTFIAPGGIEVKPFANARIDTFDLAPEEEEGVQFERSLGQVGVDIRYPFIKSDGPVDWTLEPRVQVTQSFGDAKLDRFVSLEDELDLTEDAGNADLDQALLWQSNKSSGFDFWQKGLRADVGGTVTADWGKDNYASLFVGQSFALESDGFAVENLASEDGGYLIGSGLEGDQSDIVGEVTFGLGKHISSRTRLRYDENTDELTRIDSTLGFSTKWLSGGGRYYRLNSASRQLQDSQNDLDAPPEELSGRLNLRITDRISTSYSIIRDLDRDVTRRQTFGVKYRDDCLVLEVLYTDQNLSNDAIQNNSSIGVRVALLTLGGFGG